MGQLVVWDHDHWKKRNKWTEPSDCPRIFSGQTKQQGKAKQSLLSCLIGEPGIGCHDAEAAINCREKF